MARQTRGYMPSFCQRVSGVGVAEPGPGRQDPVGVLRAVPPSRCHGVIAARLTLRGRALRGRTVPAMRAATLPVTAAAPVRCGSSIGWCLGSTSSTDATLCNLHSGVDAARPCYRQRGSGRSSEGVTPLRHGDEVGVREELPHDRDANPDRTSVQSRWENGTYHHGRESAPAWGSLWCLACRRHGAADAATSAAPRPGRMRDESPCDTPCDRAIQARRSRSAST